MSEVAERTLPGVDPKREPKLHAGRIRPYEHRVTKHYVEIPYGLTHSEVEKPGFWVHVTKSFRPGDEVLCFAEDSSWERPYRVLFVGKTEVKLSPIGPVVKHGAQDAAETVPDEGYEIVWKGPAMEFAVIDKSSGDIVKSHLYPKDVAIKFLRDYSARMK